MTGFWIGLGIALAGFFLGEGLVAIANAMQRYTTVQIDIIGKFHKELKKIIDATIEYVEE